MTAETNLIAVLRNWADVTPAACIEAADALERLTRWHVEANVLLDRVFEISDTIPDQLLGSSRIENIAAELAP